MLPFVHFIRSCPNILLRFPSSISFSCSAKPSLAARKFPDVPVLPGFLSFAMTSHHHLTGRVRHALAMTSHHHLTGRVCHALAMRSHHHLTGRVRHALAMTPHHHLIGRVRHALADTTPSSSRRDYIPTSCFHNNISDHHRARHAFAMTPHRHLRGLRSSCFSYDTYSSST